jgi:Mor family transcriptional regulator
MQFPDRYPEPLKTLALSLSESMQKDGIDPEDADRYAMHATENYRFTHGGDTPYIPKGVLYEIHQEWVAIFEAFRGDNHDELAHQFDTTPRHIRRIVAAMRKYEMQKRQGSLEL